MDTHADKTLRSQPEAALQPPPQWADITAFLGQEDRRRPRQTRRATDFKEEEALTQLQPAGHKAGQNAVSLTGTFKELCLRDGSRGWTVFPSKGRTEVVPAGQQTGKTDCLPKPGERGCSRRQSPSSGDRCEGEPRAGPLPRGQSAGQEGRWAHRLGLRPSRTATPTLCLGSELRDQCAPEPSHSGVPAMAS